MATIKHAFNNPLMLSDTIQTKFIKDLSETASKVALHNFDWRFMTMVYLNASLFLGADIFLKLYRKTVVIGQGMFNPKYASNVHQYVLFGNQLNDIEHVLKWMQYHDFDNTGKFIIICQDPDNCNETIAMQTLWKHKITNVIFLKIVENEVTSFTYIPLNNSSCIYDVPVKLINLTSCLDSKELCKLFPIKLYNLNGCPLIASTFIHKPFMNIINGIPTGTDGNLLYLLAEKLNGKLSVMTPKIGDGWGALEPDGTWSGSLGDVYYDYANFSMTSAALSSTRFMNFQFSAAYNSDAIAWVTPTAEKIPPSLKLSYPFQENARIALAITFIFVIVCSFVLQSRLCLRFRRKLKLERPRSSILFYSWMICMGLGMPATRLPKKTALLYIVLLWMWFCIFVRTCYQVSLITAMKTNYYYQNIKSIEDIIKTEYPIGSGAPLKEFYIDYPKVYKNWKVLSSQDIIPVLREIAHGKKFAIATSMLTIKTIIWEEKINVNVLPEQLVVSPVFLLFKKYSPLTDAVNRVLIRLQESGFTAKICKDYAPTVAHTSKDSLESIKLEHYTGCYAVLMTGWLISFLSFIFEIIFDEMLIPRLDRDIYFTD